jgi:glycosyltransferase involved in cell wall biosynthesis
MRVCLIHNRYGSFSGEEAVVEATAHLLRRKGHEVIEFTRSSADIEQMRLGKARAFFSGAYSWSARRRMRELLREAGPDIVHVHNIYPLISPSVLPVCRRAGVPVVMTVHNYRLICPNGLHMTGGQVCEKCRGGREYWCVLRNCEGSIAKSLGYALRNWVARKRRAFLDNVTMYAALTEFQRQRLIAEGFPAERIAVIPNMVGGVGHAAGAAAGDYVAYVGRISPEKGVTHLLSAARGLPDIAFKAAGSFDRMPHLAGEAPPNFEFLGFLKGARLGELYGNCRVLVLPSVWYETFGLTLAEAALHAKPVVCSRIGGLPEIVDDGVTGLLFEPGNAADLAVKIRHLWDRPDLCRQMGEAGRAKALRVYSSEAVYQRLISIYHKAIALASAPPAGGLKGSRR